MIQLIHYVLLEFVQCWHHVPANHLLLLEIHLGEMRCKRYFFVHFTVFLDVYSYCGCMFINYVTDIFLFKSSAASGLLYDPSFIVSDT